MNSEYTEIRYTEMNTRALIIMHTDSLRYENFGVTKQYCYAYKQYEIKQSYVIYILRSKYFCSAGEANNVSLKNT